MPLITVSNTEFPHVGGDIYLRTTDAATISRWAEDAGVWTDWVEVTEATVGEYALPRGTYRATFSAGEVEVR